MNTQKNNQTSQSMSDNIQENGTEIDYLDEDPDLLESFWNSGSQNSHKFRMVRKQLWVCVSFLSPEGVKNCSIRGLKIRGVFGTEEHANQWAEIIRKHDKHFDVFVGEMGKWLPWDPEEVEGDVIYQNKEMNELMKSYKEGREKAAEEHQERVKKDVQGKTQLSRGEEKRMELKRKFEEKQRQMEQSGKKFTSIRDKQKQLEDGKEKLEKELKEMTPTMRNLEKIKQLHSEMQNDD